jgi:magnesium-transporting ATPase (P-type)
MACNGMRALALATRKFDCCRDWCDECKIVRHLTLIGIVAIDDPLRCEIADCAERFACAGVQVKLLTGETLLTAQTVAHRSGVYDPSDPNQLAISCKDWNQVLQLNLYHFVRM